MKKILLSLLFSGFLLIGFIGCTDNKESVSVATPVELKDDVFLIDDAASIKNLKKSKEEVAKINMDNIEKLKEIYEKSNMPYKVFEKNASDDTSYVQDDSIIVTKGGDTDSDFEFDIFSITLYQMSFFINSDKELSKENTLPRYDFLIDLTPNKEDQYDINHTIFPEVYSALVGKNKDFSKINTEINDNISKESTDLLYKHTFKFNDGDFLITFKLKKNNSLSISITSPNYLI